jgi:hypothetical protein
MKKFPGFNPLNEEEAMGKPEGTPLSGGGGPKENLPKQPTEMTTHGEKSLLGKHQTNNLEGTPTIPNTGKGMTGKSADTVKENISRLSRHVKRQLHEASKGLRGKYNLQFALLVAEAKKLPDFIKDKKDEKAGKKGSKDKGDAKPAFMKSKDKDDTKPAFLKPKKKRTKSRDNLAEALADAEELLQMYRASDVSLEATFLGPKGQIALRQDIPLFTINQRGPVVGEGKALFRFHQHAEAFANQLACEGVTARVQPHNWGSAVSAKASYAVAANAFSMISEARRPTFGGMEGNLAKDIENNYRELTTIKDPEQLFLRCKELADARHGKGLSPMQYNKFIGTLKQLGSGGDLSGMQRFLSNFMLKASGMGV